MRGLVLEHVRRRRPRWPARFARARPRARFYPTLNQTAGSWNNYYQGSQGAYYGTDLTSVPGLQLPVAVRKVGPQENGWCQNNECIEVLYGLAYRQDMGDIGGLESHVGDSEMYAVLLAHRPPGPSYQANGWQGVSHDVALTSASHWRRVREFAAAHRCTASDSSSFVTRPYSDALAYAAKLWVADGKNATYFSAGQCDAGAFWMDSCDYPTRRDCPREVGIARLTNVGESACHPATHFDHTIPDPAKPWSMYSVPPQYDVWSGLKFGESTPYAHVLVRNNILWGKIKYHLNCTSSKYGGSTCSYYTTEGDWVCY